MKRLRHKYQLMTNSKHKYFSYKLTEAEQYSIKLHAALFLDEQCYLFNKRRIITLIDDALRNKDYHQFHKLSTIYSQYIDK